MKLSNYLEKDKTTLGVYLASDFPINSANQLDGEQLEYFKKVKIDNKPNFFFTADISRETAMFADIASADACVTCHNKHIDSPKKDWKLGDVMGATTWTHPKKMVTLQESLRILKSLRNGFTYAYGRYLTKVKTFKNPPIIGDKWPRDGYFLPDLETFLTEGNIQTSSRTIEKLLSLVKE